MKAQNSNPWIVAPKSFVKLLGAEYDIMVQAGAGVLGKFYVAAISIVIIIFISFASIGYAIDLLFHDLLAEVLLSIFFALLFACIYIFLINTFSKEQARGKNRFLSTSNIIRTSFVVFIACMVAQPLAIAMAGDKIERQTNQYKAEVLKNHLETIRMYYSTDMNKLEKRKQYCLEQNSAFGTHHFDQEIVNVQTSMDDIIYKVGRMGKEAKQKINSSSFFLYQMQMETRYISSWLLTVFIIALFLLPGYLIYSISADNAYYALKKEYERKIVTDAYNAFTKKYKQIFLVKYAVDIELFSRFEDLPFKQVRKPAAIPADMDAFLKKYITAAH